MNVYLDDDSAARPLVAILRKEGHEVVIPAGFGVGMSGAADPRHLRYAIRHGLVLLTRNHADFVMLHDLVVESGGGHPGILLTHSDNDPTRDLTYRGIATAIGKLEASGVPIEDRLHVLNYWR